jgi:hypothetical protein
MWRLPIRNSHQGGAAFAHMRAQIMIATVDQGLALGSGQLQRTA